MKKKLLCIGLGVVLAVSTLSFAACGGDDKAELQKQLSAAQTTLEQQETKISALEKDKEELQQLIDKLNESVDELKQKIKNMEEKEMRGKFYSLEEAYENGWLTKENLINISYYYNGDKFDVENYMPQPLSPTVLSDSIQNKLKWTYLYNEIKMPYLSLDYVNIYNYYGTYRDCIVVDIKDNYYKYDLFFLDEHSIGGVKFYKYSVNTLKVWQAI